MLFHESSLLWRKLEYLFKDQGDKKMLMFSSRSRSFSSRRDVKKTLEFPLEQVSETEIVMEIPREVMEKKLEIGKFSISPITMSNFQYDYNTSEELTELIFKEYKRYLILLAFFGSEMIYPPYVKQAWDFHLLESQEYNSLCLDCLEKKIHSFFLPKRGD